MQDRHTALIECLVETGAVNRICGAISLVHVDDEAPIDEDLQVRSVADSVSGASSGPHLEAFEQREPTVLFNQQSRDGVLATGRRSVKDNTAPLQRIDLGRSTLVVWDRGVAPIVDHLTATADRGAFCTAPMAETHQSSGDSRGYRSSPSP